MRRGVGRGGGGGRLSPLLTSLLILGLVGFISLECILFYLYKIQ